MRECINDALSLSEDNAVDDDNPVGEDHQHLEETFDDFDQHPLDTHDTSHENRSTWVSPSRILEVLPVCPFYCNVGNTVESRYWTRLTQVILSCIRWRGRSKSYHPWDLYERGM